MDTFLDVPCRQRTSDPRTSSIFSFCEGSARVIKDESQLLGTFVLSDTYLEAHAALHRCVLVLCAAQRVHPMVFAFFSFCIQNELVHCFPFNSAGPNQSSTFTEMSEAVGCYAPLHILNPDPESIGPVLTDCLWFLNVHELQRHHADSVCIRCRI